MFQDKWSRWHHKPIKASNDYSSNNAYIYTSECVSTGLFVDYKALQECFHKSQTEYGFTRHPDQPAPALSHDEILGASYLFGNEFENYQLDKKWARQYWQICDLPNFKPVSWWKLDLFKVIPAFYKIYQQDRLYTKTNGKQGNKARHYVLQFPEVYPVAFKMNGWKRYLIKRHMGVNPSIYEYLSFFISKLFTIYSKYNTSSLRLLGFQLNMLFDMNLMEKLIDKLYRKKYNLKVVASEEYSTDHPILNKL